MSSRGTLSFAPATAVRSGAGHDGAGEQHQAHEPRAAHARAPRCGGDRPRVRGASSGCRPRCTSTIASASSTIDSRKCAITNGGFRSTSTGGRRAPPARTRRRRDPRQPDEVTPPRRAHEAAEHGDDHRDRHRAGEHAVERLDPLVGVGGRDRGELAAVAVRPLRAAEAGTGQAHRRAGDDDDRDEDRGDDGDPPVGARAQVRHPHGRDPTSGRAPGGDAAVRWPLEQFGHDGHAETRIRQAPPRRR